MNWEVDAPGGCVPQAIHLYDAKTVEARLSEALTAAVLKHDAAGATPQRRERMTEAIGWLKFLPEDRPMLLAIVQSRAMANLKTGKPVYSWSALGKRLNCSGPSVKKIHANGIELIVRALNGAKAVV